MTSRNFPYSSYRRIIALISSLELLVKRDPDQEIQGLALPVLEACLEAIKISMKGDPVVDALVSLVSVEYIASGDPLRAADMLVIAGQLKAAIGSPPLVVG